MRAVLCLYLGHHCFSLLSLIYVSSSLFLASIIKTQTLPLLYFCCYRQCEAIICRLLLVLSSTDFFGFLKSTSIMILFPFVRAGSFLFCVPYRLFYFLSLSPPFFYVVSLIVPDICIYIYIYITIICTDILPAYPIYIQRLIFVLIFRLVIKDFLFVSLIVHKHRCGTLSTTRLIIESSYHFSFMQHDAGDCLIDFPTTHLTDLCSFVKPRGISSRFDMHSSSTCMEKHCYYHHYRA